MAISISTFFADLLLNAATPADIAAAIGGGTLVAYDGTEPANADAALSGNAVLVTWTFSAAASQGAASAKSMTPAFAADTVAATGAGDASFFRIIDSAAHPLIQGSVGTSGADMNLTNTTLAVSDNVTLNSGTISFP